MDDKATGDDGRRAIDKSGKIGRQVHEIGNELERIADRLGELGRCPEKVRDKFLQKAPPLVASLTELINEVMRANNEFDSRIPHRDGMVAGSAERIKREEGLTAGMSRHPQEVLMSRLQRSDGKQITPADLLGVNIPGSGVSKRPSRTSH